MSSELFIRHHQFFDLARLDAIFMLAILLLNINAGSKTGMIISC
jgi:hypothetical protein